MSQHWHEKRLQQEYLNPSRWFVNLEEKRENPFDRCLSPKYWATKEIPTLHFTQSIYTSKLYEIAQEKIRKM